MEQLTNNKLECESCSTTHGNIKYDKNSKLYLCNFCTEESDSLLPARYKKTKMREHDS